jgi:type II secretory pathway pseudopilin PulG
MTSPARANDEQGAVVIIVAIVAVVLFGAAAYAIDSGNLWQARRNMVTASDASALAAAQGFAIGVDGCNDAPTFLTQNRSDAQLDACSPSGTDTRHGYVTVRGYTTVPFSFAGIFGMVDQQVDAATTAEWGIPSSAIGLRPIGLCETATPELKQWLNLPAGPTGPTAQPIKITLANSQPDPCKDASGNVAGNWGLVFGSDNATSDTVQWLLGGYPNEVDVGEDINANPGAFSGSVQGALAKLRDDKAWFPLPVFDSVSGGQGSNALYHVVAFVFVQLVDFDVSGPQAQRYITINLDRGVITGKCCTSGPDTGVRAVRICDVDATDPDTSPTAC